MKTELRLRLFCDGNAWRPWGLDLRGTGRREDWAFFRQRHLALQWAVRRGYAVEVVS